MKIKKITAFFVLILFILANPPMSVCQKSDIMNERKQKTETLLLDGAVGKLNVTIQQPAHKVGDRYPFVILMHGVMSNSDTELITQLADKLEKKGIASVRFDFNGHGKSEGAFVNMTVPKEVTDAHAIYDYLRKLDNVSEIYLLGHSQGGVVASILAGELGDSVSGVVLMAPAAVLEDQAKNGSTLGSQFDPNNLPEYISVNGYQIGREYLQSAQNLNIYERASKYEGNVSIIHGRSDEVVPYSYAQRYNEVYKKSELHLIDNENHSFNRHMNYATDIAVDFIVKRNNKE